VEIAEVYQKLIWTGHDNPRNLSPFFCPGKEKAGLIYPFRNAEMEHELRLEVNKRQSLLNLCFLT
jgi:hypothetical protein